MFVRGDGHSLNYINMFVRGDGHSLNYIYMLYVGMAIP